jgi:hypothetical protein
MVETVAPRSKRIAPVEVQSPTLSMLRFGRNEMSYKPIDRMPVVNGINRRFLAMETGKYAMTLTPPRAVKRAAGSRLAGPLVAKLDGKTTGELNAIGRNVVAVDKVKPSSCRWKIRQPPHGLNTATPNHRP